MRGGEGVKAAHLKTKSSLAPKCLSKIKRNYVYALLISANAKRIWKQVLQSSSKGPQQLRLSLIIRL